MKWRNFGLVGLLTIGAVGCSGDKPAPNTTPIRTETVPPAPPSVAEVTTEAFVESTVVAAVESSVPVSTQPQRIADDYRVPIINSATPKTDLEREAVNAATELLVRARRFDLLEMKDMRELEQVFDDEALTNFVPDATGEQPVVAVPSDMDRVVVESASAQSPQVVLITICTVDGATVYRQTEGGKLVLEDADVGVVSAELELTLTSRGWRISKYENTDTNLRPEQCGK